MTVLQFSLFNFQFNTPLALLLLPLVLLAAWWLWRGRALPRGARPLRAAILTLLIVALADPRRLPPPSGAAPILFVVDQSASLGDSGQALLREWAAQAQAAGNAALRTLLFGEALLVLPPGVPPATTVASDLGREGSSLGAALDMAAQLLPAGGRIVLLSDGGATDDGALGATTDRLAARAIPVDVWPAASAAPFDVGLTLLDVPPVVRRGERYVVTLVATASEPTSARLQLWQDSILLAEEPLPLARGNNSFTFEGELPDDAALGIAGFRAQVVTERDSQPQNDRLTAATTVAPAARLLLVSDDLARAAALRIALATEGFDAQVTAPTSLRDDPDSLAAAFDAVWLLDVSAEALTTAQMSALQSYVRDLGHGLLASGGRQSFAPGKYENTPLEAALPVRAEPPPRAERRGVTMLLIVDHSASMEVGEVMGEPQQRPTKLEMAKQAAILAVENLAPDDRVGVLQFDSTAEWVVAFQGVGAGLQVEGIRQRIGTIRGGGGTDIPLALGTGLGELAQQPPGARHAILLTDGRSSGATEEQYRSLAALARAANITLSTIAIGSSADQEMLRKLAEWGQGRYAFAAAPEELPALTIRESELLRAESVQEGDFRARLESAHPTLRGFSPAELPLLEGYVATTPRPQAEVVLTGPDDDPILAAWQYGLGRAVVWTPGVGGPWTREWAAWPEAPRFWATLARHTLPDPLVGPLALRISLDGDVATVEAEALEPDGTPINRAGQPGGPALQATIAAAAATGSEPPQPLRLRQVAPGRYRATVRLPGPGLYRVTARLARDGATAPGTAGPYEASSAIVQPYPAEYRPVVDGAARLDAIAAATGGRRLASPAEALPPADEAPAPPRRLAPWLLAAALLLWPLEIALRRGWLAWLWGRFAG